MNLSENWNHQAESGKKKEDRNELVRFEVDRLKGMSIYVGDNAISEVKLLSGDLPLGRAEAYKCPDDVFQEGLKKQNDKEYISKLITIEK